MYICCVMALYALGLGKKTIRRQDILSRQSNSWQKGETMSLSGNCQAAGWGRNYSADSRIIFNWNKCIFKLNKTCLIKHLLLELVLEFSSVIYIIQNKIPITLPNARNQRPLHLIIPSIHSCDALGPLSHSVVALVVSIKKNLNWLAVSLVYYFHAPLSI